MFKRLNLIILIIFILSILVGVNVYAADNQSDQPNIGDVLKDTNPPVKIDKEKSSIPEIKQEPIKEPLKSINGKKVLVKKIIVTGNSVISSAKLEKLINTGKFVDEKLSLTDMKRVAAVITRYYREKGFFVARAYIPKQDMKNNTLTIAVIEGRYGKFRLNNNSLVKTFVVQGMLDIVKAKKIISVNNIERVMMIINNIPGVRVIQADVIPGDKVGTSDFAITTEAEKRYSGYLIADNYGGEYTGVDRLSAAVNINSPFQIGDRLSLRGFLTDKREIENYRIGYSLPISYSGFRKEIAYSNTEYELGGKYSDLEAVGNSKNLEINFTYPIISTRLTNLKTFVNFSRKDMTDKIRTINQQTGKKASTLNTGVTYSQNHRLYNWNSQRKVKFDLTLGDLKFEDPADRATNEAGADTNGNYSKINMSLAENIKFNNKWSLNSSIEGQYALNDKNLDGSEDFSIGGSNGVKLYPSGEVSAENGYLFNTELFYHLPDYKNVSSQISMFYDLGMFLWLIIQ